MNYKTVENDSYDSETSIIDPNVTRKVLTEKYNVRREEVKDMVNDIETPVLPYVYISPSDSLDNSKYPHSKNRRLPDYGLNDKVFRNGASGIGLGYYSIE